MPSDETLRLAAQVVDQFSEPIRNMQGQLRRLSEANARSHREGTALAKGHAATYASLRTQVTATARELQTDLSPLVDKAGFGFATAALRIGGFATAIAAVVEAVKGGLDFQGEMHQLRALSRATGMSVDSLRAWEAVGPRVGASAEAMAAGLKSASGIFATMSRDSSGFLYEQKELYESFKNPGLVAAIAALRDKSREAQLAALPGIADTIKAPVDKLRFWAFLGLPENFANYAGAELREAFAQAQKNLATMARMQLKRRRKPMSRGLRYVSISAASAMKSCRSSSLRLIRDTLRLTTF
jgi:hypothetical protein